MAVACYPLFVSVVQAGDIIYPDALFILASALLDLAHQIRNAGTQVYQQVDAAAVFVALPEGVVPSDTNSIAVNDYFGRNIVTENEAICLGAASAQSGDWDNFGLVWSDDTGFTQDMSFKASSDNEDFLVLRRFFDVNRLGMGQQSVINKADYLAFVKRTNATKYKCLQYAAKLSNIG